MGCGRLGVAMFDVDAEEVDVVVSVFVVLELSEVVGKWAHDVLSVSVAADMEETSREGDDGREQSSMKRERRWAAGGEAMAIVVV